MSRLEIDSLRELATPHVRTVRSILSQLVAVLMKNSLIIGHGMTTGYATILVPHLTDYEPNEFIQLHQNKASWFSVLPTLTAFVGAILSGMLVERVERKRLMLFATITQLLSFLSFYFITELWQASVALTALGIVGGAMQVSALAYIAEVMEPRLRGILMATNIQALQLGLLIEYYIGSTFDWREAALVSCIAPVAAFCSSYIVPESPYRLLIKNKPDDARKSLAWLRGWTTVESIEEEFQVLQISIGQKPAKVRRKIIDINIEIPVVKPPELSTAMKYLKKDFLIPLVLVSSVHLVANFSGPSTTPAAAKSFFLALNVPIDEQNATVMLGAAQFLGSSLYTFSVRRCGKKKTAIGSATSVCLCNAILGMYSMFNEYGSQAATPSEPSTEVEYKWVPFVLILVMTCLVTSKAAKVDGVDPSGEEAVCSKCKTEMKTIARARIQERIAIASDSQEKWPEGTTRRELDDDAN
ncbi:facilitated trehalose transporter Tret1-like [Photinus pyralis]|uniref:facilitated trehalose transporter Tret1-like n=1 Tax=Photinus pyralis TaxID=7054 RepID=UPI0012676C2A|nr:facilitated trehalose transporter Tret1-like [Photinus pyralis]